jgi:hypothetical protein
MEGEYQLDIDIKEVLRYLGHKGQPISDGTKDIIKECIGEMKDIAREDFTFKSFEIEKINKQIALVNTNILLKGEDIYKHLENSSRCVVMAATLGSVVDFKIRYYEKVDLTKALIMDSCATAAVESLCDQVEQMIAKEAHNQGFGITSRYSPGYGDLSIEYQPCLLSLLETQKKINLTVSESCILMPRKSVTAVIGLQDPKYIMQQRGCSICKKSASCQYRRDGEYCGI